MANEQKDFATEIAEIRARDIKATITPAELQSEKHLAMLDRRILLEAFVSLEAERDAAVKRAELAEADNAALLPLLSHSSGCSKHITLGNNGPCNCGLIQVLTQPHPGSALLSQLAERAATIERLKIFVKNQPCRCRFEADGMVDGVLIRCKRCEALSGDET